MSDNNKFIYKLDSSAVWTVIGIILLFSSAIAVTLIAPRFMDASWETPTSAYQVQMYTISDPNVYISSSITGGDDIQQVQHIKDGETLLAFQESKTVRIVAPQEYQKYITRPDDKVLKLTSDIFLVREPKNTAEFKAKDEAEKLQTSLQGTVSGTDDNNRLRFTILELYKPNKKEAFSLVKGDGILENWVDPGDYEFVDGKRTQDWHHDEGVIFVQNPVEYKIVPFQIGKKQGWMYSADGQPVEDLDTLKGGAFKFLSRKELIELGEEIYAYEGCHYCHTLQTRTLLQDTVLNGSELYPAPPSQANEYIFENKTFMSTRRIGPDISRTGIKRQSRDWHKSHFWSPKTESPGSIMPPFQYFFDEDPRGASKNPFGVPNYKFEAIFQYLMTKGTRITPPTQAWWLGKDPVNVKKIIESSGEPS